MNFQEKNEIKRASNVLIASNDYRFNYQFTKNTEQIEQILEAKDTPVAQETQTETPERLQRRAEFLAGAETPSEGGFTPESRLSGIEQTGSEIAAEAQRAGVASGLRPDPEVRLEVASEASSSSSESSLADPELRRARNIQDRIARGTPTFTTKQGEVRPKFSEGEQERIRARAEKRAQRAEQEKPQPEPETLITGQGQVEELQEGDTLRTGD